MMADKDKGCYGKAKEERFSVGSECEKGSRKHRQVERATVCYVRANLTLCKVAKSNERAEEGKIRAHQERDLVVATKDRPEPVSQERIERAEVRVPGEAVSILDERNAIVVIK